MTNIEDKRKEIQGGIGTWLSYFKEGKQGLTVDDGVEWILGYLHLQDCVLKVEGELPKLGDYDKRRTTSESVDFQDGFIVAKIAMRKAGYVAVEPLI